MAESLEYIFMLVVAVIMAIIVVVLAKNVGTSNADKASAKANSVFGATPQFSLTQQGIVTLLAKVASANITSTAGTNIVTAGQTYAKATLNFVDLRNIDGSKYLQVTILNPGVYDWQIAGVGIEGGSNVTVNDIQWSGQIKSLDATYVPNAPFKLDIWFVPTVTPVYAQDTIVLKVAIGTSVPAKVTFNILPPATS